LNYIWLLFSFKGYTSNEFLFSFRGRINRAKYGYAAFASSAFCGVLLGVLAFALGRIFGASVKSVHLNFLDIVPLQHHLRRFRCCLDRNSSLLFYAGGTPIVVFGTWFLAATAVKRLHDRKSGWWMVRLLIAPDVFNRLEDRLPDSYAVAVISLVALVLCIWCFVELFCLRGTGGANRFGADPLAPRNRRPGSDQQSALEFVPHCAGPSPTSHVKRGP
jgi:uncharacterized membrane protein YhaH (DUF805 family)